MRAIIGWATIVGGLRKHRGQSKRSTRSEIKLNTGPSPRILGILYRKDIHSGSFPY